MEGPSTVTSIYPPAQPLKGCMKWCELCYVMGRGVASKSAMRSSIRDLEISVASFNATALNVVHVLHGD